MAKGKPITIETRTFSTRKEATEFFREIRERYAANSKISDDDAQHLGALLKRHTEYPDKVGVGISHFEAMISTDFGTKCFRIVRVDGSKDDFSYHHCIKQ